MEGGYERDTLLICQCRMESFFVTKVVEIKACRDFEGVVAVHARIHSLTENRDEVNRLPDCSQRINVPHALIVTSEVSVEDKHINARGCGDDLNTIIIGLVLRGKTEMLAVEELVVLNTRHPSGCGEYNTNLHNSDFCNSWLVSITRLAVVENSRLGTHRTWLKASDQAVAT